MRVPFYAPNGDPPESDPCTDLSNWRDTGDAFGTDPLATNGWNFDANGNYWLPEIQDWVHDLQFATHNAAQCGPCCSSMPAKAASRDIPTGPPTRNSTT
jgi:hypothetical protein